MSCENYYYAPPCARVKSEHEALESRLKEIRVEEDRLEAEKKVLYDQIEKLELKEQAA